MPPGHSKAELEQQKEFAKVLFIKDKLTMEQLSVKIGVHYNTIKKWAAAGEWKKLQRNFMILREEQISGMLDELMELNASIRAKPKGKRFADPKESIVRKRLVSDLKDLGISVELSQAVPVCIALTEFIRKADLAKAQEIIRWINPFIESLMPPGQRLNT